MRSDDPVGMDGTKTKSKARMTPGRAVLLVGLVVVVAALVIGAIGLLGASSTPAQATPVPAPVAPTPSLTAADRAYLASMRRAGLSVTPDLEVAAAQTGKNVCIPIRSGENVFSVLLRARSEHPEMTPEQVGGWIQGAVRAYCPEYASPYFDR